MASSLAKPAPTYADSARRAIGRRRGDAGSGDEETQTSGSESIFLLFSTLISIDGTARPSDLARTDAAAERVWGGTPSRRLPADIQTVARRKLRMLNNAATLEDLQISPCESLEALKSDRKGRHSIRINDQWRICFVWTSAGPADLEITDYH